MTDANGAAVQPVLPIDGIVRHVSILFADIVGSTRLIRDLDAEDARDLLDGGLQIISDAIHEFGGSVARIQGDGIMAAFGGIAASEDHALRAALAGIRIRDSICNHAPDLMIAKRLQVRVGVHSGSILLRWQDNDFGRILDIVGTTAHIAARVEQSCPPGGVAISGSTLDLLYEAPDTTHLLKLSLAETSGPLDVYQLHSLQFSQSDSLPVKGKTTYPLIGRDDAVAVIRSLLRAPSQQFASLGAIVGEAGIGKSRLLNEAVRIADQFGFRYAAIRGSEIIQTMPFGAAVPALKHIADMLVAELGDLTVSAGFSDDQATCFLTMLDRAEQSVVQYSPDERNRHVNAAVAKMLRAACNRQRFVLFVDDVQYLDVETRTMIENLVHRDRIPGISILLAGRTEAEGFLNTLGAKIIPLRQLNASHSRDLISAIVGRSGGDRNLADRIAERAGGLPLAIEEFATYARDNSRSAGEIQPPLPPRLESLFLTRIDALDAEASRLCAYCCALGPSLSLDRLRRLGHLASSNLNNSVQALIDNRILQADFNGHILFSHQLVQEAGYGSLMRRRRIALHTDIYHTFASEIAPPLPFSHAELARHAELAGMHQEALRHLWKACEEAITIAAIETVHAIYHQARVICQRLGAEGQRQSSKFALLALDALQQLSYEQDTRRDLLALTDGTVDLGVEARTLAQINMALLEWIDGANHSANRFIDAARQSILECESFPRRTYLELVSGYIDFIAGRPVTAVERFTIMTDKLRANHAAASFGAVVVIPHIMALSFGAWYSSDIGNFEQAQRWSSEALSISGERGHNYSLLVARKA